MLYGSVASELEPLNLVSSARFAGAGYFRPNLPVIKIISASFAGQGGFEAHAVFASGLFSLEAYLQGAGSLNISTRMLLAGQAAFAGAGNLVEQPRVAFNTTFDTSGSIAAGMSWRQVVTPLSVAGPNWVRVTLKAGTSAYQLNNVSIGVQSTTYNTNATPVELLFNGSSGFSISANQTIVSDWAKLSFAASDKLVVIGDAGTGGAEGFKNGGVSCTFYNLASTASYNQASPAGSWSSQAATSVVQTVETLG